MHLIMKEENKFNYHSVFNEIVDSVFITDGNSAKIIDVNKSGCHLLGYNKEEIIGNNLYSFIDDNLSTDFPKSPSEIKMFGSVLLNKKIKTKSGDLIPVDMTLNTFTDETGNYVMTSLRDVSERVRYENKILEINDELIKSNASKDKFFSIIAHDLKNPISAIISISEIVTNKKEEVPEEELNEFTGMIKNLSEHTYELLENLLNWSRIQTNKIEVSKSNYNLNEQINKIIKILSPTASLKNISIKNRVNVDEIIFADSEMINTVIRNLVSNSIKFSMDNSVITVSSKSDDGNLYISVTDEGIGMEENYIKDLFKIDVHTSRYGTNKEKGTGLGLVLCNEFIMLHKGSIKIVSELNKGTEFTIQLPKESL